MRNSNVEVQPLDLTVVRIETMQLANHVGEFKINQARSEDWGIVQTSDGIYGISRDGAGNRKPISEEDPLMINIWTERVVTDDIGRPVTIGTFDPQWHVALNEKQALGLQTGSTENLTTFIVDSAQESFEDWNEFISYKFHWDIGDLIWFIEDDQIETDTKSRNN